MAFAPHELPPINSQFSLLWMLYLYFLKLCYFNIKVKFKLVSSFPSHSQQTSLAEQAVSTLHPTILRLTVSIWESSVTTNG